MNYAEEVERISEEYRRQSALRIIEIEEHNAASAARLRDYADQFAAAIREDDNPDEVEPDNNEAAGAAAERLAAAHARDEVAANAAAIRRAEAAIPIVDDGEERQPVSSEVREAIARSIAARKARDEAVYPTDDPGDEDAVFYRERNWWS